MHKPTQKRAGHHPIPNSKNTKAQAGSAGSLPDALRKDARSNRVSSNYGVINESKGPKPGGSEPSRTVPRGYIRNEEMASKKTRDVSASKRRSLSPPEPQG